MHQVCRSLGPTKPRHVLGGRDHLTPQDPEGPSPKAAVLEGAHPDGDVDALIEDVDQRIRARQIDLHFAVKALKVRHHLHEAVSQKETDEVPEGQVVEQLRKGYKLKDRLLRAASVVVAKAPGGEEAPAESADGGEETSEKSE